MLSDEGARALDQKAQHELSQGKLGDALETYRTLTMLRPHEPEWQVRAADVCVQLNDIASAVAIYERVAENYARRGEPMRSLRLLKVIQSLIGGETHDEALAAPHRELSKFLAARYAGRAHEPEVERPRTGEVFDIDVVDAELVDDDGVEILVPTLEMSDLPAPQALPADVKMEDFRRAFTDSAPRMPSQVRTRVLPKIPLFSALGKTAFQKMLESVGHESFGDGGVIVREGDIGDRLFIVLAGEVVVLKDVAGRAVQVATLKEGAFFGEMALLAREPRQASCIANGNVECVTLSRKMLEQIVRECPSVKRILVSQFRQRLLENVVSTSPLFTPFPRRERKQLIQLFKRRDFGPGEALIEEGKPAKGLFVIVGGRAEVVRRRPDGGKLHIADLKQGDVFGEISLLNGTPAIASVVGRARGEVLRMPVKTFNEVIMTRPQVLEFISALSARRQAHTESLSRDDVIRRPVVV